MNSKRRSLIILSWLITRLWRGIELSRLAIFRVKPQAVITFVSRHHKLFPRGIWVHDKKSVCWIGVNETVTVVHLRKANLESN